MRTLTHLYDNATDSANAITALEGIGIPRSDISVVSSNVTDDQRTTRSKASGAETGATVGATVGGGAGLLAGVGLLAIPGLGPVVAAGWFASTIAGLVAGSVAGGLVGALTDAGVDKEHAHVYAEGIRRGGSLLTVRVSDDRVTQAEAVLAQHRPVDPTVRANEYRTAGWKGFDDTAGPYIPPRV